MKRVLALHGVGSSAAILKDQLTPIATELGPDWEFIYLDGAIERPRGPGMAPYYTGPFYSYTTGYTPNEIRETLDDIEEFIQDNGPFVGVIGFSQGASMAASYLLDHAARKHSEPPPFEFAILFSSVAAFSPDESCCDFVVQDLLDQNYYPAIQGFPEAVFSKLGKSARTFAEYLALTFQVAKKIGAVQPTDDIAFFKERKPDVIPRVLHPAFTRDRVPIPTVHFTGKKDLPAMVEQSDIMYSLCDPSVARLFRHSGGHSIPAKSEEVKKIVSQIEWAASEGTNHKMLHQALHRFTRRQVL